MVLILRNDVNNNNFYSIHNNLTLQNKIELENKINTSTQSRFAKNCKKCRNRKCVSDFISNAIGDGSEEVYISVTPNTTLGVQTSVTVCSASSVAELTEE